MVISGAAVAVAVVVAGTFLIVQNNSYNNKKEADSTKQVKIDECIRAAHKTYIEYWKENIKLVGGEDGSLPSEYAAIVNQSYADDKEQCFKIYAD